MSVETCAQCGAQHSSDEAFCWMCHQAFARPASGSPPAPRPAPPRPPVPAAPPPAPRGQSDVGLAEPALILTIIAIGVGAYMVPEIGRVASALLFPMLLVVGLKGPGMPKAAGEPKTLGDRVIGGVQILAKVVAILILAQVAVGVALFATCMFILKFHS